MTFHDLLLQVNALSRMHPPYYPVLTRGMPLVTRGMLPVLTRGMPPVTRGR